MATMHPPPPPHTHTHISAVLNKGVGLLERMLFLQLLYTILTVFELRFLWYKIPCMPV